MSPSQFSFPVQHRQGQAKELDFLNKFQSEIVRLDGRKHDFVTRGVFASPPRPLTIELKSDSYQIDHPEEEGFTKNFFIERYSDAKRQTPGGPWQALLNGTDLFAYWFYRGDNLFLANVPKLVKEVSTLVDQLDLPLININNQRYITQGYRVPRGLLDSFISVPSGTTLAKCVPELF